MCVCVCFAADGNKEPILHDLLLDLLWRPIVTSFDSTTETKEVQSGITPKVDFIKVKSWAQIIEIALAICALRLRPTF